MSLVAQDVSIRFGGVAALNGVGVEVSGGAIQGVIGPNGSGKSTLFNCLTGFARPDSGRVAVDGTDLSRVPAHRRIGLGVARTFQTPRFDPAVTVWQAVACGFSPVATADLLSSALWLPWVRARERQVGEGVSRLLDHFRLTEYHDTQIGELPLGHVRLVEVARAMAMSPKYLLLDEPAAGLGESEQRLLAEELRRLAADGVGVLIVEHNFDLVLDLCDRILVLSGGQVLLDDRPETVAADPRVRRIYLGYAADQDDEEEATAP